ncbi:MULTISPECIES: hypothetical protein [Enterobacterales]|uniref:hypothetical protein n=1 Tax=Enterobacterales TaxID=91347 RepID=UPI00075133D9|nr:MULTISPECIES: hypothetical protein [Enterobacterales]KUQ97403.1 hypothetical protein AWI31_17535 [Enterobacter hormaechei subsp. xiangfangensis]MCK6657905.1 hypothetical protein [Enterobacter asburiae]
MTKQQSINFYKSNGFTDVSNNLSGIGTDVLVKGATVVRIGDDPGYSHFAKLIVSGNSGLKNVVKIFTHSEPLGNVINSSGNGEYSITEIELLTAMSQQESVNYQQWASTALSELSQGKKTATDPFGLVDDIDILFVYARNNNLYVDLINPKNVMKRGNDFIILDPFF